MSTKFATFAIVWLLLGLAGVINQNAKAQNNPTPTTATRPHGPEQSSVPNNSPPASRTQTTGQESQDRTIKEMNTKERDKIEREGK